jgi:hypothetical protein
MIFLIAVSDTLKYFGDVCDNTKKNKMGNFKQKSSKFLIFLPSSYCKSPTHTGLICVKTPEPNTVSQDWALLSCSNPQEVAYLVGVF